MPESFGSLLAAGLAAVRRDAPLCSEAMAAALGPVEIALVVDGEQVVIDSRGARGARREVTIERGSAAPARADRVHVATTGGALLALLDGRDELHAAIVSNRVRVRASTGEATRLFDAMRYFVEGCARASAAPDLLARYRAQVASREEGTEA